MLILMASYTKVSGGYRRVGLKVIAGILNVCWVVGKTYVYGRRAENALVGSRR